VLPNFASADIAECDRQKFVGAAIPALCTVCIRGGDPQPGRSQPLLNIHRGTSAAILVKIGRAGWAGLVELSQRRRAVI